MILILMFSELPQVNASVKGYPLGAIFSFRYAGLDSKDGTPQYYVDGGKNVSKKRYFFK